MTPAERTLELAMKGLGPAEISRRTGRSVGAVKAAIARARKAGDLDAGHMKTGRKPMDGEPTEPIQIRAKAWVADYLQPHAEARGITVNRLASRILEAIAADEIVDAVLDDKAQP